MLTEIRSDKFRTGVIGFHSGLNVVLGDENATNSIGKSSLLTVIDFAFGGNTLVEYHKDTIRELGDHDYYFAFSFADGVHRFRRGTHKPSLVYPCDPSYAAGEPIDIEDFTTFLKLSYSTAKAISFRALVGLYSRIWGKDNLDVHRPLHAVSGQPAKDCVVNLIKAFDRFEAIERLETRQQELQRQVGAFQAAFKNKVIPEVGLREYRENEGKIASAEAEISDIKNNLSKYSMSISEIANREVLELKLQKDELLALKLKIDSQLNRTRENLASNRHIKSRHFAGLIRFFPDVNNERIAEIEEFHNALARILKIELRSSERELRERLEVVQREIDEIDTRMASLLGNLHSPHVIVDRVFALSATLQEAQEANRYHDSSADARDAKRDVEHELTVRKSEVLNWLENYLNDSLRRIMTSVFGADRKSPEIKLRERNYSFKVFEDTGTGTAYVSLLVFDLAIFLHTSLPIVVHDSVLFKNIENDSVAHLLSIYEGVEKQSFIAIDEVEKYGLAVATWLRERSVIKLDDTNILYIKDWRTKNRS